MKKLKGKTPTLISGSSGKPNRVSAGRQSNCKRCDAVIQKGNACFEIPNTGGAFRSVRRYCAECFKNILQQTKQDLTALEVLSQQENG